jgi:TfoX/Sxy family transcriptional regulator of competence genes
MPAQKKPAAKKTTKKTAVKAGGARKAAGKTAAATKMPSFRKSPPELVALFAQVMAGVPQAQTRQVFGSPAAFANSQMFAGVHDNEFFLRLPAEAREAFLREHGAHLFEPMPGRPMREYVIVPPSLLNSGKQLDDWLGQALAYALSLPPKTARPKRK